MLTLFKILVLVILAVSALASAQMPNDSLLYAPCTSTALFLVYIYKVILKDCG